jgi:hypothetical protein
MGQVFKLNTTSITEALAQEQARVARLARSMPPPNAVAKSDLAFASREERAGATLLREIILQMDIIHEDAEATIMRLIVPNSTVERLEMWGVDNLDNEDGMDREFIELSVPLRE